MPLVATVVGGLLSSRSASSAADAQAKADAARLEEEKRVREQLRLDTETQRTVADQAFADYNAGLISYAEAQKRAGEAMSGLYEGISDNMLSDVSKTTDLAKFQPYAIRTGTGRSFVNPTTGEAGFALSPEAYGYQQDLYKKAGEAVGSIATSPEAAASQYYQQQQGLLQPQRQAEDQALRASQLQSGRIGLGIASEAAGAGAGGMVNPDQFRMDRARALADAKIAADATQFGMDQQTAQLNLAKGMFSAGMAPEDLGLNQLEAGVNLGSTEATAGLNMANLYNRGMTDYYKTVLGAGDVNVRNATYVPGANIDIAKTQYDRQQKELEALTGNKLPYETVSVANPTISGGTYLAGMLGNTLMDYGMNNLLKPV